MNRSIAGLMMELLDHPRFGEIYGAVHSLSGLLKGRFIDLRNQPKNIWRRVGRTPGAILGSGRQSLRKADEADVLWSLEQHQNGYLFTIGGNDSAVTAHTIATELAQTKSPLVVIHIPKTIDNDLMNTDHSPGYGSAARFIALAAMGAGTDAQSMGDASPITIVEVMGRDAGWLAAASALGKRGPMDAPIMSVCPKSQWTKPTFWTTWKTHTVGGVMPWLSLPKTPVAPTPRWGRTHPSSWRTTSAINTFAAPATTWLSCYQKS